MAQPPRDHTRALVASLFTAPPGSPTPHAEQHVAHVQTFEGQEGTPSRKARFLIISAVRDGRLKLHKAKENTNGTFSIGKTWGLEELRQIEVARRTVNTPTGAQSHPLEFTLTMNGKQYRYETELPSSQQAAFLVRMVRCWRTYMAGRDQPDLVLIGFNVDNSNGAGGAASPPMGAAPSARLAASPPYAVPQPTTSSTARENFVPREQFGNSTHSTYSTTNGSGPPSRAGGAPSSSSSSPGQSQSRASPAPDQQRTARPSTAASTRTTASTYRRSPSPPPSAPPNGGSRRPSVAPSHRTVSPGPPSAQQPSRVVAPPQPRPSSSAGPAGSRNGSTSSVRPASTATSSRSGGGRESNASGFASLYDQDPRAPAAPGAPQGRNGSGSVAPPLASRQKSNDGGGVAPNDNGGPRSKSTSSASGVARAAPQRRPSSPPLAGATGTRNNSTTSQVVIPTQVPRRSVAEPEESLDDDTVLTNVEEMLEGFEWRGVGGAMSGGAYADRNRRGKADEIEKRLVGELKALEAASIHAIIESDDGVNFVIKHLDDALAELDKMDLLIGMYKSQLNLMSDDIAHIESQNRGLQVQTSNQRMLLSELDNLMETIHIPASDLTALVQESLENSKGIERLEKSAISLYKALLSTRDTSVGDMAAASERVGEYRTKASQFCKRIFDFLAIMFKYQVEQIQNPKDPSAAPPAGQLPSHAPMEEFLERYCGLMLFVKEIDYTRYQQICAAYFTAISDLHRTEIQGLMSTLRTQIRKATEEEQEANFANVRESPTIRQQSMRRVGTAVRSPHERNKDGSGKISGGEAFKLALGQVTPRITREQSFISDFLAINPLDASITFADYMQLETYFRRGATTYLASQQGKLKDIKSGMELVFGFLEAEIKDWSETIVRHDNMQIVGILAALDGAINLAKKERNEFLLRVLQKQYQKSTTALERSCKEAIKNIEATKLTLKKRKGVVPFVRIFPNFVARIESQLEDADKLNVRGIVDSNYERIIATIFDSLQQMAKMDGEGQGVAAEDKDQLNYHVIIIENMHHITTVFARERLPALDEFVGQAREKYNENLDLYIKLILRRPLARPLDFFHGLEQLLRTTPPTEVSLHNAYTKGALRRTTSDLRAKDLRKAIDALYKRVDKHFGDVTNPSAEHAAVIKEVWKACEGEVQRLTSAWKGLIDRCYPDEKGGLEFSRDDVREYFAKAQV